MKFHLIILLLLLSSSCSQNNRDKYSAYESGQKISGKVIKVIDGDTYDLLTDDKKTIRVRMEGIDAPEKECRIIKHRKIISDPCA